MMDLSLGLVGGGGSILAASYAMAGLVDWRVAGLFIGGGRLGSLAGTRAGRRLATRIFAGLIIVVAAYMLARSTGIIPSPG